MNIFIAEMGTLVDIGIKTNLVVSVFFSEKERD